MGEVRGEVVTVYVERTEEGNKDEEGSCKLEDVLKREYNDFFFLAEDGIRGAQESRGLGDV